MRTFAEVAEALDLQPWRKGHVGRLYLPRSFDRPRALVRHFDSPEIAGFVGSYAEVVSAFARWLAARPDVAELVEVRPLTEVGIDFVARVHEPFYYGLAEYDDPEEYDLVDVVPPELAPMRALVQRQVASGVVGRDEVLQEVVMASLLGPSRATIMGQERFLVVSPVVLPAQLERWASA